MQYVHRIQDLNSKSIDIESVPLIRTLKQKTPYPLSEEKLRQQFSLFFVSPPDQEEMQEALQAVDPAIKRVLAVAAKKDPVYEGVNLLRTVQILQELPSPLQQNIRYYEEMTQFQQAFFKEATPLLNAIPSLQTEEEKIACNEKLGMIFQTLLKSDELFFNSTNLINESHVNHMKGLLESLEKGYLFYFTVEEELKKVSFETVKLKLPQEKLSQGEAIYQDVFLIKRGVDRAYDDNMRMTHWAIHFYAYIKWLSSK